MKKIICLLLVVVFAIQVFAKKVDSETAKFAAKNLYFLKINQNKEVKLSAINLALAYTEVVNNEPVYYAFNVNEKEGFVIISADDIAKPCIGYSFEGPFVADNLAPSFKYWMSGFCNQIAEAVSRKATASIEVTQEWAKLLTENPVIVKSKSIQPLILTNWNQGSPYNDLCPVDAAGPGGHVYVGCVATAMIQVMKYYNYPDVGVGTHTHYSDYGNLTVNYASQNYVWENMPNNSSNNEIAKLGYHGSVALNMGYSPSGSGAQANDIPTVLASHFKYSNNGDYIEKNNYTNLEWENLIKDQIDNKWPIVYCGFENGGGGHAWNCDGYTGSDFHMNWGWGGSANGFFTLDNLIAGGYNFSEWHSAAINLYPAANYPEGCTSTKIINGEAGSFNDGSGNQNYSNNKDCLYLIQLSCASTVDLVFDRFNLGAGDVVYVYGGATTNDPLIGTFNSANIPTTTVSSNNGAMLIRFVTNSAVTAEGWYASYSVFPCHDTRVVTNLSGTITDGSLTCDYNNYLNCRWDIAPAGTTSSSIFHLTFPDFNFASGDAGDYIKIYKNTVSTYNVVGVYNSSNLPPAPLDIVATKLILKFQTNNTGTSSGWTVNYSTTLTGIENNLAEFGAGIYPNPFNNDATITYTLNDPTNVKISVTNVLGQEIGSYVQQNVQGVNNLQLSSIVNSISQGVYFVNLSFNNKSTAIKIVCTK